MELLDRRSVFLAGAAIAAPVLGMPRPAAAAAMYGPDDGKEILPGVQQVDLGERPVNFATYKKAKVIDYIFAPGSGFPDKAMNNDLICQMLEGKVLVKQGELEYTPKKCHVFACDEWAF